MENDYKQRYGAFIVGENVTMREIRISDVKQNYYKWMNDNEVTQYLECRYFPNTIEALIDYVTTKISSKNELLLAIIFKELDLHIGNIKVGPINWIHRFTDIGMLIGEKNYWGKGLATEAIGLIADYAFSQLNLHKVIAGCYSDNRASLRAFQKNGFEIEGKRKQHRYLKGKYHDSIILGKINKNEII